MKSRGDYKEGTSCKHIKLAENLCLVSANMVSSSFFMCLFMLKMRVASLNDGRPYYPKCSLRHSVCKNLRGLQGYIRVDVDY